jgi:NADH dehydrogenase FAD-containing subunit
MLDEEVHSVRVDMLRMLEDAGVEALTAVEATEIREDGVTVRSRDGSERYLETDFVVVATGMAPLGQVAHQLAGECGDVHIVGDCLASRRIRDAVVEGNLAGRLI